MPLYDFILLVTKYGVAALFVGCILLFVILPMVRGLRQGLPEFPHPPLGRKPGRSLPLGTTGPQAPTPPTTAQRAKNILELARQDPGKTAQILRSWLHKDHEA